MANALGGFGPPPTFDVVGPTVDDDVRRMIARYGAEAVANALKRATKAKRGRRPEKDWPELRGVIDCDARNWLAGEDPFSTRSNYSIAKDFADQHPGHSHPGTMKRIERKLAKQRVWMTLVAAYEMSERYPYSAHLRALSALVDCDSHPVWSRIRDRAQGYVADYHAKLGEAPPTEMTIQEVEDAAKIALIKGHDLAVKPSPKGLFGAIRPIDL